MEIKARSLQALATLRAQRKGTTVRDECTGQGVPVTGCSVSFQVCEHTCRNTSGQSSHPSTGWSGISRILFMTGGSSPMVRADPQRCSQGRKAAQGGPGALQAESLYLVVTL